MWAAGCGLATLSVLQQLREKQSAAGDKFVSYRESILTQLFKSFFIGNGLVRACRSAHVPSLPAQVSLILCTSQAAADADETKHVLEFAAMASEVKTAATPLRWLTCRCNTHSLPPALLQGRGLANKLQEEERKRLRSARPDATGTGAPEQAAARLPSTAAVCVI